MRYPELTDEELDRDIAALPFKVGDTVCYKDEYEGVVTMIRRFQGGTGSWDSVGHQRLTVVIDDQRVFNPWRCALVRRKNGRLATLAMRYRE